MRMVLICPHCNKKHTVDEKKIPGNVKKARCKFCGQTFLLKNFLNESGKKEDLQPKQTGPRKIAVSLSKGGVGKTTTSVNLAAGLALAGFKVLLVDTDTQGQDSFVLGVKPQFGLTELVTGELTPEETIIEARKKLWLLAGGKSLAGLKRIIDRKDFGSETTLAETLMPIENQYDFIIIDYHTIGYSLSYIESMEITKKIKENKEGKPKLSVNIDELGEKLKCSCGNDKFYVFEDGYYLTIVCTKCKKTYVYDLLLHFSHT